MNISKFSAFFHDGSLLNFKHSGNSIEIAMMSSMISPEHMIEDMPPLKDSAITGKLYLEGVKKITINKKVFEGILVKEYDSGAILDFDIFDHKIELGIEWMNYPPKQRKSDYSMIIIEAEKIWWENLPDLLEQKEEN